MSQTSAVALGIAAQITSATRVVAATRVTVDAAFSFVLIVYLAIVIISIVAAVKVVSKAGYSPWWVLITLVPVLNFVMMLVFAFSEWPVEREVERLRAQVSGWSGYGPASGYGPSPGYGAGAGAGVPPYPSGDAGPAVPDDRGPGWAGGGAPGDVAPTERSQAEPLPPFGTVSPGPAPDRAPATEEAEGQADAGTAHTGTGEEPQAQAGWYPTPDGRLRYWDGTAWTDHFA